MGERIRGPSRRVKTTVHNLLPTSTPEPAVLRPHGWQLRPGPAQPKARDPRAPLCFHATSSPSASAMGFAFQIYPPSRATTLVQCHRLRHHVASWLHPLTSAPDSLFQRVVRGILLGPEVEPPAFAHGPRLPPHMIPVLSCPHFLHSPLASSTPATLALNLPPGLGTFCSLCLKCFPCQLSTQLL